MSARDRALLSACAARRTRPEHVRVDDVGHERLWLELGVLRSRADRLLPDQPRRLGEHLVADRGDDKLGVERLAGVPRRTLVLTPAALGAGKRLQQLLLVEVLDLPGAEDRVLVLHELLEIGRRTERAQRLRLPLEEDGERRREDVHVLA